MPILNGRFTEKLLRVFFTAITAQLTVAQSETRVQLPSIASISEFLK